MKRKLINKLLPIGSTRRKIAKQVIGRTSFKSARSSNGLTYQKWIQKYEPLTFYDTKFKVSRLKNKPLISIVVPCYNTPKKYIVPLIDSVTSQIYENWELCLADGSTDITKQTMIKDLAKQDHRINYIKIDKNLGISGNTNVAIENSNGQYIAFMDHDDTLSKYALAENVIIINNSKADVIYSDEDKLSDDGKNRLLPFFKPGWSPDFLLNVNYITHFLVAKKTLVNRVGRLRDDFNGAQDYDLILRLTEKTNKIEHISKILYHWRLADGSTSSLVTEKSYANTAGKRALAAAVKRRGMKAEVTEIPERPTNYRLKLTLPTNQPKVSIIIPFKDKVDLLKRCIESVLDKTTYKNYELILISNSSSEKETFSYLSSLKNNLNCRVFEWNKPFNYSKVNNFGRKKAKGEYLVLLNNDTEVISPEWLDELIGLASQPNVGEVGALLRYPNKTIQHAGVILGMDGMAGHVFRGLFPTEWTDFGLPVWGRDYLAVTAACVAIKGSKFDEVGGLDEEFIIAGNDVALGIKLHEAGYRNVFCPYAELIHYENTSVGSYQSAPKKDYDHSLDYYKPYLNWHDPYFNANLDLMSEQIALRSNYD